jgi:L-aspartate oxidase
MVSSAATGQADRVIIVGGGIAGLATALHLAPIPVTLVLAAPLGIGTATAWAQGGIAAALDADDSPRDHAEDTLRAGAGLSEPHIVSKVTAAGPDCLRWLSDLAVPFDRSSDGTLALGLEGAHWQRRISHVQGDRTGAAVLEALLRAVALTPSIEIMEQACALDLLSEDGVINGVLVQRTGNPAGQDISVRGRAVVLATGGIGGIYRHTTNPLGSVGSGLAMTARAGALLRDMEFVQFHPTAIDIRVDPMPLATEALRGEGAILVNEAADRFMADVPGRELAARDVVARSIFAEVSRPGGRVFLDARCVAGGRVTDRFPGLARLCKSGGLDPASNLIPVRPAAHYHMGGIAVDERGRTSLAGLWACGEVASTGLHGANRLASNSLLEALAFSRWIAEDIGAHSFRSRGGSRKPQKGSVLAGGGGAGCTPMLREIMDRCVGMVRNKESLEEAVCLIAPRLSDPLQSVRDQALVGLFIAVAALARCESRGAHLRTDYPHPRAPVHSHFTLADVVSAVSGITGSAGADWQEVE